MNVHCGTSGFSYKQWKGPFYPEDLPEKKFLTYYAEHLPTVEINATYYRMPKAEMLSKWAEQVPESFQFVIKSPGQITHKARLGPDALEPLDHLWKTVQSLGSHLGPILFQMPPYFRADLERLRAFTEAMPEGLRATFEFRHASWDTDETRQLLRDAGYPLCTADTDKDEELVPIVATADWGYLRLRRSSYTNEQLEQLAAQVRAQSWKEAFVFFKHEDEGAAPKMATRFRELCSA